MSKNIIEIFEEIRTTYNQSKKKAFDSESLIFKLYRNLSFPITAIFIKLRISANVTTFLSFICIIISSILFINAFFKIASLVYFFSYILDFVDGNIARYYNKTNYFGKFIDGLVDSFLYLIFISIGIGLNINLAQSEIVNLNYLITESIAIQILFYYFFNIRISFLNLEIKKMSKIMSIMLIFANFL